MPNDLDALEQQVREKQMQFCLALLEGFLSHGKDVEHYSNTALDALLAAARKAERAKIREQLRDGRTFGEAFAALMEEQ